MGAVCRPRSYVCILSEGEEKWETLQHVQSGGEEARRRMDAQEQVVSLQVLLPGERWWAVHTMRSCVLERRDCSRFVRRAAVL